MSSSTNIPSVCRPISPRPSYRLFVAVLLASVSLLTVIESKASVSVNVLYLQLLAPEEAILSTVFKEPRNSGLPGAQLAIQDNNTTGRFLKQTYQLEYVQAETFPPLLDKAVQWIESGQGLVVANMPADDLLKLADHPKLKHKILLFNAGSGADTLRHSQCTTGLLHTAPSRAMLADALGQLMIAKRWQKWFLVQGQRTGDTAFANSLKRSAKRYGADIVKEKTWSFNTDLRRVAQKEIPAFTRARSYDVVVVADELGDVGEFIPYNTWLPRPVAGTQGLTPTAWHKVIEQWGALQLHSRFEALADRYMNATDYAAWLAVRVIGEAVTRQNTSDAAALYQYMLSEQFEIAAFKGRKMSFRPWNGQMRQPIALVQPRALISQSPQEGYLHPNTDLDTLGYDQPEVDCRFNTKLEVQ